jgi:hypothetical protein
MNWKRTAYLRRKHIIGYLPKSIIVSQIGDKKPVESIIDLLQRSGGCHWFKSEIKYLVSALKGLHETSR